MLNIGRFIVLFAAIFAGLPAAAAQAPAKVLKQAEKAGGRGKGFAGDLDLAAHGYDPAAQ
jgi:hypothetical protein